MAKNIPTLVRGLGVGSRLLSRLMDEITARGGYEEMLYFLSTDRGEENLGKVAALIMSLPYAIPKSEIMRRARAEWVENHPSDPQFWDYDEHFSWEGTLEGLGIPLIRFADAENIDYDDNSRSLDDLRDQFEGKPLEPGMRVTWKAEEYSAVGFVYDWRAKPGDIINFKKLQVVYLAPAHYIDLER